MRLPTVISSTLSVHVLIFSALFQSNECAPPLGFLPNIVIFFCDDLGYFDIENYGHPQSLTPNVNKLMSEGTKLTSFYVSSPVCSPSRAALLTGRFQTRSGVWPGVFEPTSVGGLPLDEITIAELLKLNGLNYSTAIVGKWHLGVGGESGKYLPTKQGFDFYTGIPFSHDMPNPPYCFPGKRGCWPDTPIDPWNATCPDSRTNDDYDLHSQFEAIRYRQQWHSSSPKQARPIELSPSDDKVYDEQSSDSDPPLPLYWNNDIIQQPVNITMLPQWYTNAATHFMNQSIVNKQPFFLYMAFHQTHHPQFASSQFFNTSQRGMFGDALREMDYNLGLILQFLERSGVDNETLVIFSSDNGPSLVRHSRGGNAGPLKCGKGTTYEGGMRMPAALRMPSFIEKRVSRELASSLDILPTIAELVDVSLPTDRYYDGVSMYSWLFEGGHSKRDTIYYWPKSPSPDFERQQSLQAIRVNQWKLRWIKQGSHCSNDYADADCRANQTATLLKEPILINLYHDIGEAYPVNVSEPYYARIVDEVNAKWKEILDTEGLWGLSQMMKGKLDSEAPCCQWHCDDFPSCCVCDKINNTYSGFHNFAELF